MGEKISSFIRAKKSSWRNPEELSGVTGSVWGTFFNSAAIYYVFAYALDKGSKASERGGLATRYFRVIIIVDSGLHQVNARQCERVALNEPALQCPGGIASTLGSTHCYRLIHS